MVLSSIRARAGYAPRAATPKDMARFAVKRAKRMAQLLVRRVGDVLDEDELVSCGGEAAARCLPKYDPTITPFRPYLDQRMRWAMLHEARRRRRRTIDPGKGAPTIVAQRYRDKVPNRVRFAVDGDSSTTSLLDAAKQGAVGRLCAASDVGETALAPNPSAEERVHLAKLSHTIRSVVAGTQTATAVHRHAPLLQR